LNSNSLIGLQLSAWAIDDWGLFYYSTSSMIAHDDARPISALCICTDVRGASCYFLIPHCLQPMSQETPKMSDVGPKVLVMRSYKPPFRVYLCDSNSLVQSLTLACIPN
jgi:hypothetical protein